MEAMASLATAMNDLRMGRPVRQHSPSVESFMPYVISQVLDDDRYVVVEKPNKSINEDFFFPLARGEALTPRLLASKPDPYWVQGPRRGRLPEIFGKHALWTIKESVRDLIETLEPSVHNYIPVNLRVRGSSADWGQYYLLVPGQAINAVVIDDTDFVEGRGRVAYEQDWTLSSFGETVVDGAMIRGRHLWRGAWGQKGESSPFFGYLFCSDELADRIQRAGIEGWCFRRCKLKQDC